MQMKQCSSCMLYEPPPLKLHGFDGFTPSPSPLDLDFKLW